MEFINHVNGQWIFQVTEYPTLDGCIMNAVATGKPIKNSLKHLPRDYEKIIIQYLDSIIRKNLDNKVTFAIIYDLTQFPFISVEEKVRGKLSTEIYWKYCTGDGILMVAMNNAFYQPFTMRYVANNQ